MNSTAQSPSDDDLWELLTRTMHAVAQAAPDMPAVAQRPDRRWMAVAAAVATIGIAGGGWAAVHRTESHTLPPLDPNDLRPTLDSFRLSYDENVRLSLTSERMYRDCMAVKGQIYTLPGVSVEQVKSADLDPLWGILGRTDPQRAATVGYQPFPVSDVIDLNQARATNSAWQTAFAGASDADGGGAMVEIIDPVTGLPTPGDTQLADGCFGAVQDALFSDQARFTGLNMYVANQLDGGRIDMDAGNDPRLTPFLSAWSDCLVEEGHERYRAPLDAMRHFFEATPDVAGRQPAADEVATAIDDVACKRSTGLLQMTQDLHDAYAREAAASAPEIVAAHRAFLDHALAQAAAFESGSYVGPWRDTASADSLHNSDGCIWFPDDVAGTDMSIGERVELNSYLDALTTEITNDAAASGSAASTAGSSVDVPPWLIGQATCLADPTVGQIAYIRATASP